MTPDAREHVTDLLPAHLNRTLEPAAAELVKAHLASCEGCRFELLEWQGVADASRALMMDIAIPSPLVMERVRAAIAASPSIPEGGSVRPSATHLWQVLHGQMRFVQPYLWAASAVVMVLGLVVAATGQLGGPGVVLQLVAPIVAAAGVSVVYGPEVDPSLELALAAPTSARLILLARLTLVFGYDLALVLAATVGLAALGLGGGFWALSLDWLGPMLFLSALALVLSLQVGPSVAVSVAFVLWMTRVIVTVETAQGIFDDRVAILLAQIWSTNLITLLGTAVLIILSFRSLHTKERFA